MASHERRSDRRRARKKDFDLSNRLVTVQDPTGEAAEAYRLLRTNLLYALVDNPPEVILLTSPGSGEGKSVTCANLGAMLANGGKDTLIADCDLRNPVMHLIFRIEGDEGLVNLLVGERTLPEVIHEPLPRLKVLTTGPATPNPAELLDSERFVEFLRHARKEFDYVLLDSPPLEGVSDPVILATRVDGVLMVLDAQSTRKGALRRSMRSLEAVGVNVLGTVMNNVESPAGNPYFDGQGR